MSSTHIKLAVSLADAERRYKNAVESILDTYGRLNPVPASQVSPQQLDMAIVAFLETAKHLDKTGADPAEISRLGDYGITLLMDLFMWAQRLGLGDMEAEFDLVALAFADWTIRHQGQLRTIEPLVDALANQANRIRDPKSLERLTHLMTRIVRATAPDARTGIGQTLSDRPWRLLNLNRGIVATRTHNASLMEEVFDELVDNLPSDAREFFAEGMQQMEALNYPTHVRAVMTRYFDRWTRARMH